MRISTKEELINKTNNISIDIMLEKRLNFLKDFERVLKKHCAVISEDSNSSDLHYTMHTMLDNNFNTSTYLLAKYGSVSFCDVARQINELEGEARDA